MGIEGMPDLGNNPEKTNNKEAFEAAKNIINNAVDRFLQQKEQ